MTNDLGDLGQGEEKSDGGLLVPILFGLGAIGLIAYLLQKEKRSLAYVEGPFHRGDDDDEDLEDEGEEEEDEEEEEGEEEPEEDEDEGEDEE